MCLSLSDIAAVSPLSGLLSQMSLAQILRNFAQNKNNPALYLQTWKNFKKSIFCGIQSMSDFQTQSQGLKFKTYINEFSQGRNLHFYFGNDDHTSFSSRGQLMESSPAVALHWKQLEMEELESFHSIGYAEVSWPTGSGIHCWWHRNCILKLLDILKVDNVGWGAMGEEFEELCDMKI